MRTVLRILIFVVVATPVVAMGKTSAGSLPLVDVGPSAGGTRPSDAVLVFGVGVRAGIDRSTAGSLTAHEIPVTGSDSLRYFWRERKLDVFARDLEAIIDARRTHRDTAGMLSTGVSRDADVLPSALARLHSDHGWHVRFADSAARAAAFPVIRR